MTREGGWGQNAITETKISIAIVSIRIEASVILTTKGNT